MRMPFWKRPRPNIRQACTCGSCVRIASVDHCSEFKSEQESVKRLTQWRGVRLLASGQHELIVSTSEYTEKIVLRGVSLKEIARGVRRTTVDDGVEYIRGERRRVLGCGQLWSSIDEFKTAHTNATGSKMWG